MKKYTIKDKSGIKKTIYAKDLSHALTFVDSKIKDKTDLNALAREIKAKFKTSCVPHKDDNALECEEVWGNDKLDKQIVAYLKSKGIKVEWDTIGDDGYYYLKDSIKDEANLPTTIQALVNDEEAAIKAYEVAIKNLESKIDETQMQVLINIMKDERRHVENLYAILNGQVTEKNLEDSIHDGVNEARDLVERAGFKVLRAYGSDNEPYITIKWDGSYSELRKKVSALKSEAKKIGYKDVYADGNDICFSKW